VLPHIKFLKVNILKFEKLKKACESVDTVFHQAAKVSVQESIERMRDVHDINLMGTLNVLQAAKECGAKKFIHASSAAVYGDNGVRIQQEDSPQKMKSPYGVQKAAGEAYGRVFHELWGMKTVALRYFNIFGARQNSHSDYAGVITLFTDLLKKGEVPCIFGDGQQTRDFICVKDVVTANLCAAEYDGPGGEAFNIGSGKETSILELYKVLSSLLGVEKAPHFQPARKGEIVRSCAAIEKAKQVLGFEPMFSLKEGLNEMLGNLSEKS
jgi:UDP-glucose 4-epimerase